MVKKPFIATVRIVCGGGFTKRSGVRLSVIPFHHSHAATAGLLLSARLAGHRSIAALRLAAAVSPQHGAQQQIWAVSR